MSMVLPALPHSDNNFKFCFILSVYSFVKKNNDKQTTGHEVSALLYVEVAHVCVRGRVPFLAARQHLVQGMKLEAKPVSRRKTERKWLQVT